MDDEIINCKRGWKCFLSYFYFKGSFTNQSSFHISEIVVLLDLLYHSCICRLSYLCSMNLQIHSPLQRINSELLTQKNVSLWVKRDDLIHAEISGNKYRKLKYNLRQAELEGKRSLLTFGGAFSNHIAATAVAGKEFGFETIGIIRGEETSKSNSTLAIAQQNGMNLKFVSRQIYSDKMGASFLKSLKEEFGEFYCIPEGGANELAMKGCSEILREVEAEVDFVCVPCGTGTTLAGLLMSMSEKQTALGFPVLKNGGFIAEEVQKLIGSEMNQSNMALLTDYHFGGYAKLKPELVRFANWFYKENNIPLDLVYTAKMFYGIFDLLHKDYFPQESRILAVHTGGLQGNIGMIDRYGIKLDFC